METTDRIHLILRHLFCLRTPGGFPVVSPLALLEEVLFEANGPKGSEPDRAAVLAWASQDRPDRDVPIVGGEVLTISGRVEWCYRVTVGAVPRDRLPYWPDWLCAKPSTLWRHPEVAAWWDGRRIC